MGGAIRKDKRRRKWNEEVQTMKEIVELDREVTIASKRTGCETNEQNAKHKSVQSVPGLILDLTGTKCDRSINKEDYAAKKSV